MDRDRLARLLVDLKRTEGAWRTIERRSGVANSTLSLLSRAAITPQPETIHRLAQAYPEIKEGLYEASGYTPLAPDVPGLAELVRKMEQPPDKVIEQAVKELATRLEAQAPE